MADPREVNRGNALFCNLSCVATNSNRTRLIDSQIISNKCPRCGEMFETKAPTKIYCSQKCKSAYRYYSGAGEFPRSSVLRKKPCEVCGWNETTRDIHHITSPLKGGTNDLFNVVVVCPNHHRLIHNNLVSQDDLFLIIKSRTISSSADAESDALAGN